MQGKYTESSAREVLKIRTKCHRLNTAKGYKNTTFEYTIEYTKNRIKDNC